MNSYSGRCAGVILGVVFMAVWLIGYWAAKPNANMKLQDLIGVGILVILTAQGQVHPGRAARALHANLKGRPIAGAEYDDGSRRDCVVPRWIN